MNRVIILSYTERGGQLNNRVADCLRAEGDVAVSCPFGTAFSSTAPLLESEWKRSSAFVFIGAAGIAVRHIAPYLTDKLHDPSVLVIDEAGRFVVPILSGHVGGGVSLAHRVAEALGAQAVITTATDVSGRFAVDVFAACNHLCVPEAAVIRELSAAVLRGETLRLRTGVPILGDVPAGVGSVDADGRAPSPELSVGYADGRTVCRLAHRSYIVGVGCKKGKSGEALYGFLREVCAYGGIDENRIAAVASVDAKREEPGIWELARRLGAPYETFSAGELMRVGDQVHASAFVERTVGVDNVCERSALYLAGRLASGAEDGEGAAGRFGERSADPSCRLVVEKQVRDGMTLAVAMFQPAAYRWVR